jgi:hypothetical protein
MHARCGTIILQLPIQKDTDCIQKRCLKITGLRTSYFNTLFVHASIFFLNLFRDIQHPNHTLHSLIITS